LGPPVGGKNSCGGNCIPGAKKKLGCRATTRFFKASVKKINDGPCCRARFVRGKKEVRGTEEQIFQEKKQLPRGEKKNNGENENKTYLLRKYTCQNEKKGLVQRRGDKQGNLTKKVALRL